MRAQDAGAAVGAVVRRAVEEVAVSDSGSHLGRAVAALAVADAADRLARAEVLAAREEDGATWEQVGAALGISRQAAHERFRTGPDGMHSRLYKGREGSGSTGGSRRSRAARRASASGS